MIPISKVKGTLELKNGEESSDCAVNDSEFCVGGDVVIGTDGQEVAEAISTEPAASWLTKVPASEIIVSN